MESNFKVIVPAAQASETVADEIRFRRCASELKLADGSHGTHPHILKSPKIEVEVEVWEEMCFLCFILVVRLRSYILILIPRI